MSYIDNYKLNKVLSRDYMNDIIRSIVQYWSKATPNTSSKATSNASSKATSKASIENDHLIINNIYGDINELLGALITHDVIYIDNDNPIVNIDGWLMPNININANNTLIVVLNGNIFGYNMFNLHVLYTITTIYSLISIDNPKRLYINIGYNEAVLFKLLKCPKEDVKGICKACFNEYYLYTAAVKQDYFKHFIDGFKVLYDRHWFTIAVSVYSRKSTVISYRPITQDVIKTMLSNTVTTILPSSIYTNSLIEYNDFECLFIAAFISMTSYNGKAIMTSRLIASLNNMLYCCTHDYIINGKLFNGVINPNTITFNHVLGATIDVAFRNMVYGNDKHDDKYTLTAANNIINIHNDTGNYSIYVADVNDDANTLVYNANMTTVYAYVLSYDGRKVIYKRIRDVDFSDELRYLPYKHTAKKLFTC